ncbi:MAG: UTP--glucose-1-phosphate uridylyltransferase GalU [Acidimicrobiales bacterium]
MVSKVRKAVIPAAGLGTRFLPATKAQPKEMLPLVDTPAIQYVVEEAVASGIRDILVITGRGKRSLEDHFDRSFELEHYLEASGRKEELAQVRRIADMADIHYVRQGEPKGLGHAVATARQHVGDEPFVVLLGDDIMDPSAGVLPGMLSAFDRHGRSLIALKPVEPAEISSYGCARAEPVEDNLVRILEIVEKPAPEEAPSNLAVMGRYVFTPAIFDALERVQPGRGGEIQLTDAIGLLLEDQAVHGYAFEHGRYDTGNKLDYLRATVELALARPDLGPQFRRILVELVHRLGLDGTAPDGAGASDGFASGGITPGAAVPPATTADGHRAAASRQASSP